MNTTINTARLHRDEVLMYDGNLVGIIFDVEVETHYDSGDYWTKPCTSHYINDVKLIDIDAFDGDDNVIEVDCSDLSDPYVQCAIRHVENNPPELSELD